ncbi:4'-phosphopantetheinyl transferase family protein [Alteromonas sp. 14N.309.X.WAT.G.H12]|uniref:4'-phosphopantetheinyl transferase family protein n=1 Tax=Alteromonas sp. 14N.309.X.WAT.G.H12 TaxID=3120824 RepID=UPI002FCE81BB
MLVHTQASSAALPLYVFSTPSQLHSVNLISWLSEEEQRQRLQRRHPNRQAEFIISRALIKKQLGLSLPQAKTMTLRLKNNYLACDNVPDTAVSLSHSHGLLAFSIYTPSKIHIGVDIELRKPRQNIAALSAAFHTSEQSHNTDTFYLRWTAKEALAKALSLPLTEILSKPTYQIMSIHRLSLCTGLLNQHRWTVAMSAGTYQEVRIHRLSLP